MDIPTCIGTFFFSKLILFVCLFLLQKQESAEKKTIQKHIDYAVTWKKEKTLIEKKFTISKNSRILQAWGKTSKSTSKEVLYEHLETE